LINAVPELMNAVRNSMGDASPFEAASRAIEGHDARIVTANQRIVTANACIAIANERIEPVARPSRSRDLDRECASSATVSSNRRLVDGSRGIESSVRDRETGIATTRAVIGPM